MKKALVTLKDVSKAFIGVQALSKINLTINGGEILCLVGENGSGKSTLVKIITGVHRPDEGEIIFGEKSYPFLTPRTAIAEGVEVIYQDLSLFPHMTVAENIAISRNMYNKKKFVDWREVRQVAQEQLDKIGVELDLEARVGELSIGNQQITAICRALALDAKILFMDEPTTALTKKEVARLLEIVQGLREKGMAVVFISHKLDEVMEVADRITILRDGKKVGDFKSTELDEDAIVRHMTGRDVTYSKYRRESADDTVLLEVRNLTKKGQYEGISFQVRKGDILGLAGLLGAGRRELALSLFGLNPPDSGEIYFEGKPVTIDSPAAAKALGIGFLPEDRYTQGLFLNKDVTQNISSTVLDELSGFAKVVDQKAEERLADESIETLKIRTSSRRTVIKTLSGGNQQKAVIGKWMAIQPKLLILNSPTVGIDVGAKSEIYERIQDYARGGMGLIYISDEINQIVNNCNRVLVMANGRGVAMLEGEELASPDVERQIEELISKDI